MEFSKERIQQWHAEGVELAYVWKRCEHRMVEILGFMHQCKGYYLYECASLREYAIQKWKLPENAARDLVTVAIKALEIPEMLEALKSEKATVSKLRKVCPVINEEEKVDWLMLVEKASARDIEKVVAIERPGEAKVSMHYLTGDLVDFRAAIPEKLAEDLKRIQDLLSQQHQCNINPVEALQIMARTTLDQIDPIRKAERAEERKARRVAKSAEPASAVSAACESVETEKAPRARKRTKIRAATQHARNLRDRTQCTATGADGKRCLNKRWTETHHIKEVANGGTNDLVNLTTLCSQHHNAIHHPLWPRTEPAPQPSGVT